MDCLKEAGELFEYTRNLRRDIHLHPELGFQEIRTAGIIARELSALGLDPRTGIAKTGVTATLKGKQPGPVVLLRFDMDALPIQEETGAEYASTNPGVMHACGHDGHTAIGLTVAKLLNGQRDRIAGTVLFVFQPAEEGLGGAEQMIAEGILANPKPDISLALHLWNEKPTGWLGIANGPAMAGAEIFTIKVRGKGGHAAAPHLALDPILCSAQIMTMIQSIVARNIEPIKAAVVSICTIHGGEAFNVIPKEVIMSGTIRTFEPSIRSLVIQRFNETVCNTAAALGCQAEIDLKRLTPSVINDPNITQRVQKIAQQILPDHTLDTSDYITMGSEDFAFIMEQIPGCFIALGSANKEKGLDASHHHPGFDFDESVLVPATALLAAATLDFLKRQ